MDSLPSNFAIAVHIYRCNLNNVPVYFTKLVDELEGKISRDTISKNIDQMLDIGMITGHWQKDENGRWIKTLTISENDTDVISALAQKYPVSE